jgi:hypothetical protein
MLRKRPSIAALILLLGIMVALLAPGADHPAAAQEQPILLRVEEATTGTLNSDSPGISYTFFVHESIRMGFIFDVIDGDMQINLTVYSQDGQTVLAQSGGLANNGVVVRLPMTGQYYLQLAAVSGTSASYRLMIDADPPVPVNAFVAQSYLVRGLSTKCEENVPTTFFAPEEDLNVCFVLDLIDEPSDLKVEWWSPSGEIFLEETAIADASYNLTPFLSGIVFQDEPFEPGWWQVHLLLNGELHHIQWVRVE